MNGSTACDIAQQRVVANSTRRVAAKGWSSSAQAPPPNVSCGCYTATDDIFATLDAGAVVPIGGVDVQGRDEAWVTAFQVSHSTDNATWARLGGLYRGNTDGTTVVQARFPYVVQSRYLRIHVAEFFKWPALRAALLEAVQTTCLHCPEPAATCPRRPNMVLSNASNCTYACKPETFGPHCHPRPRVSASLQGGASFGISRRRPPPIAARLHCFDTQWALQLEDWHGTDIAVKTDGGPWMAWDKKPWGPQGYGAWLLLPAPVSVRVRLRVLWNNTRLLTLSAAAPTRHGATASLHVPSQLRIEASWGMGDTGTNGDSQAICSVRTSTPATRTEVQAWAFETYDGAWGAQGTHGVNLYEAGQACANVSHGIQWLRRNTELQGVDAHLGGFIATQCQADAWIVPQVSRAEHWYVALMLRYEESR